MPYPKPGESKKDYISRFMGSGEAQSDFPDEKQRLAVAYSMFEKKNATSFGMESQHPWPKKYTCSFIEPGVVFYQDLGPCKLCGDARTCMGAGPEGKKGEGCDTDGETILVKQEALASMAQSFVGKPVIDLMHKDIEPNMVANGEADGIVTRVWLDEKSGWWMCEFLVWSPQTQLHCESPRFSVSCAYDPMSVNTEGGEYHNIPYAEEILTGEYTHLAIVTNPRYEGARILVNSKGGKMSWKFWEKGARKNAAPIDPSKEMVNVDGTDVPLSHLYDALPEPEKKEAPKYNDDTMLETPKGEKSLGELKQAYRNKMKKNAEDEKCPTCGQKKNAVPGATGAEAGHAEHREGGDKEAKLPDLKSSQDNPSQSEEAAKKLDAETKEKQALELQQAKDAEEKKNAADADAKAAEEKKNAEAKAAEEMKNAEEKADKEKELANSKEAGRKSFETLRNARLQGEEVVIKPVSADERLARGKQKYGSAA